VPRARFLGVTPQDIIDYGPADATHPLTKTDIRRATDAIDNDPFYSAPTRSGSRSSNSSSRWAQAPNSKPWPGGGSTRAIGSFIL